MAQEPVPLPLIIVAETTSGKHILVPEAVQELLAGALLPTVFG